MTEILAMLAQEEKWDKHGMYVNDPVWWLQQKLDGDRLMVVCDGDANEVVLLNRKGDRKTTGSWFHLVDPFKKFLIGSSKWIFDGELINGELWLFDILVDIPTDRKMSCDNRTEYVMRHKVLSGAFERIDYESIHLLHTAKTTTEKQYLVDAVCSIGGEGVIARQQMGTYEFGGRSQQLRKLKRVATADCIVKQTMVDGKENAILGLLAQPSAKPTSILQRRNIADASVAVGKCSLIGKPVVSVGDVVEVKFLYVGANGRLYQPRLVKVRHDKGPNECTLDQLEGKEVNKDVLRSFPT